MGNFNVKLSFFVITYMTIIALLLLIIVILPFKKIINRKRPNRIETVYRVLNMWDKEVKGKTKNASMPSGDTFICAWFLSCYFYVFGAHWLIFIMVIFVALGRVYVHCHWIGDTIIGSLMGMLFGYLIWADPYFSELSKPFLKLIVF